MEIHLTTRETAAALGVSIRTVQRWAKTGKLKAAKDAVGRWAIPVQADLDGFKATQVERARELIAQGGIIPVRGRRIFLASSDRGDRTYLTAPQACTCKAGLKGRHACFHRIAAIILAAV